MFRFAPSSKGDMHIEDLRMALFNFICAKQQNDRFIVRIENIDKKSDLEEKTKDILDILGIFGITYDDLYYRQNNFKYHLQFASTLLDQKKAFMCFCTEEELKTKRKAAVKAKETYKYDGTCEDIGSEEILNNRKPFVIRIKKPKQDLKSREVNKSDEIDSFLIMSVDKYPTHDFACAIDDMLQGVTYIISSEKYLLDMPKQEHIRKSLGYDETITYVHLSAILDDMGEKIDESSVKKLLDQGFMPEAIINYLVLLGNTTPKEIFTMDEVFDWFDLNLISKLPAKFDIDKLRYINVQHIKLLSDTELAKRIGYSGKGIGKLAKFYTEEASTTYEIKQKIDAIFATKTASPKFAKNLEILKEIVQNAPIFDEFEEFKAYLATKSGFEGNFFDIPLKILLTNNENGIELARLYPFIKNYLKEIAK